MVLYQLVHETIPATKFPKYKYHVFVLSAIPLPNISLDPVGQLLEPRVGSIPTGANLWGSGKRYSWQQPIDPCTFRPLNP
jgi:hypothetical protein